MGLNSASGAFAALTNVRSASARPVGGPSRGALVLHALERPGDETAAVAEQYSSFNLWHGSAFAGGSAQVTRSRFRARSEEGGIAEVSGAWVADTLPVAPGEVAAHSNEGDTACGDEPWAKSRHLRAGVASLLAALPTGSSAEELREALAALLSESLDDGALAALGGPAASGYPASHYSQWQEAVLQRGPLVSRRACRDAAQAHGQDDWAYGTSSQTVLLSSARERCVFFFQRSIQNIEQAAGEWEAWAVPWSDAAQHAA